MQLFLLALHILVIQVFLKLYRLEMHQQSKHQFLHLLQ